MVKYSDGQVDRAFQALSDSTRRVMLAQLTKKECTVSELADPHDLTFAAISKHLKVLEKAELVEKVRDGRTFRCRANIKPIERVYAVLDELGAFWRSSLDSLDQMLSTQEKLKENSNESEHTAKRTPTRRGKKKNSSRT